MTVIADYDQALYQAALLESQQSIGALSENPQIRDVQNANGEVSQAIAEAQLRGEPVPAFIFWGPSLRNPDGTVGAEDINTLNSLRSLLDPKEMNVKILYADVHGASNEVPLELIQKNQAEITMMAADLGIEVVPMSEMMRAVSEKSQLDPISDNKAFIEEFIAGHDIPKDFPDKYRLIRGATNTRQRLVDLGLANGLSGNELKRRADRYGRLRVAESEKLIPKLGEHMFGGRKPVHISIGSGTYSHLLGDGLYIQARDAQGELVEEAPWFQGTLKKR